MRQTAGCSSGAYLFRFEPRERIGGGGIPFEYRTVGIRRARRASPSRSVRPGNAHFAVDSASESVLARSGEEASF